MRPYRGRGWVPSIVRKAKIRARNQRPVLLENGRKVVEYETGPFVDTTEAVGDTGDVTIMSSNLRNEVRNSTDTEDQNEFHRDNKPIEYRTVRIGRKRTRLSEIGLHEKRGQGTYQNVRARSSDDRHSHKIKRSSNRSKSHRSHHSTNEERDSGLTWISSPERSFSASPEPDFDRSPEHTYSTNSQRWNRENAGQYLTESRDHNSTMSHNMYTANHILQETNLSQSPEQNRTSEIESPGRNRRNLNEMTSERYDRDRGQSSVFQRCIRERKPHEAPNGYDVYGIYNMSRYSIDDANYSNKRTLINARDEDRTDTGFLRGACSIDYMSSQKSWRPNEEQCQVNNRDEQIENR